MDSERSLLSKAKTSATTTDEKRFYFSSCGGTKISSELYENGMECTD